MSMLGRLAPEYYVTKLAFLLIGCVILGAGVYLEILADVAMLPGESFVRAVSATWNTEFGITKICFDVSMTVIAGLLSIFYSHQLQGVREGTIIAALLVGFIARLLGRKLAIFKACWKKLLPWTLLPQLHRNTGCSLSEDNTEAAAGKSENTWPGSWAAIFTTVK